MKIIAHRGYSHLFPENTIISFQKAIEFGADKIELDVHFSADKKLVVHHDYSLGSTNNGTGAIFEKNSEYIVGLDAGSWFGSEFSSERVPLLEGVFSKFGDSIEYEIELKGFTKEFVKSVVELAEKYKLLDKIEFTSPHLFILVEVRKQSTTAKLGVFLKEYPAWMPKSVEDNITLNSLILLDAAVAHCPQGMISSDLIELLRKEQILIHAADCNDQESITSALTQGVDQISTNMTELAVQLRKTSK